MWRFIHGISRGFKPRTPAPPSQTVTHEDNENVACSSTSISSEVPGCVESHDPLRLTLHSSSNVQENSSCQARLQQPSEADILLRGVFGESWKNHKYGTGKESSQSDFTFFEKERIRTGLTLGTAGMTIIMVGRGIFSSWQRKWKRREIIRSRLPMLQDHEQRYISQITNGCSHIPRLSILPSTLSTPFIPTSVQAAGGDSSSCASNQPSKKPELSISHGNSSATFYHPPNDLNRKVLTSQKSVTFDEKFTQETKLDDSDDSDKSEKDEIFSDEALSHFTQETKECSGATFNILGMQSTMSNNYKEAITYFKLGCAEGHAGSCFNLGLCYQKGLGTRKSMDKAVEMYKKAADKGHTQAQYNLAIALMKKEELTGKVYAVRLLEKASIKGMVKAQSYLGVIYTEQGPFQNFKKAVEMFKMAAESGDPSSKFHLGICYERGLGGLKKDPGTAFDLYASAAAASNLDAQYNMAVMLETGFPGAEKNPQLAKELFQSGAKAGHKPSQSRLKQLSSPDIKSTDDQPKMFNVYYSQGRVKTAQEYQNSNQTNLPLEVRRDDKNYKPAVVKSAQVPTILSTSLSASLNNQLLLDNNSYMNLSHAFYHQMKLIDVTPDTNINSTNSGLLLGMRRSFTTPGNLSLQNVILKSPSAIYSAKI